MLEGCGHIDDATVEPLGRSAITGSMYAGNVAIVCDCALSSARHDRNRTVVLLNKPTPTTARHLAADFSLVAFLSSGTYSTLYVGFVSNTQAHSGLLPTS
jgi:hypothetical protein